MRELEFAGLDSVRSFLKRKASHFTPEPGDKCANCETELTGLYCHACGQAADNHHRSIGHLILEGFEGVFHMDSRLWRTLPPLFLNPGLLARDYMTGRLARHVPPFRTFLVSLLLFIFAAEGLIHKVQHEAEHAGTHAEATSHGKTKTAREGPDVTINSQGSEPDDTMIVLSKPSQTALTPEAKTAATKAIIVAADKERDQAKVDAAKTRDQALKSAKSEVEKAAITGAYDLAVKEADETHTRTVTKLVEKLDKRGAQTLNIFSMTPEQRRAMIAQIEADKSSATGKSSSFDQGFKLTIAKAIDNPKLFVLNVFTWGHRLAVLLLPIMTLLLALLYAYRRKFFIFDHFLVSCNILSFMFLTNAFGFILPEIVRGWWFLLLMVWTPVNIFMTLRGAYESGIFGALIKTTILWTSTTVSFLLLVMALAYIAAGSM